MLRLLFSCFVSFLISIGNLHAERTIRVLHYGASNDSQLKEVYIHGAGAEPIQLELNRHNFSPQLPIAKETKTLKVLSRSLTQGEPFPKGVPSTDIPADWQHTLLIFYHEPKNPVLPIKIYKINASEGAFNPGELYWINLSDVYIGGVVGGQKLKIGPRKDAVMKCPSGEVECTVKLDYLVKGETKTRGLIRQMWAINKDTRQVVIIFNRPPPKYASYYVLPFRDPPKRGAEP